MPEFPFVVGALVLPLAGAALAFLSGRAVPRLALAAAAATLVCVAGVTWQVGTEGALRYPLGGWEAPLGIDLYVDGLAAMMLLVTGVVSLFIGVYAHAYYARGSREARYFWPLWLMLLGALNALFVSADLFNLYVTLELVGLAAVALAALSGSGAALVAAMRYLLVTLLGSLLYLMGVALLYAAYGTLDIALAGTRVVDEPVVWAAFALITLGMWLKIALFPLHFWLPPAHANATGPVSALLSGLVIKAAFYLLLRLWILLFPEIYEPAAGHVLGAFALGAIVWGSLHALRQRRLKLLVAYSTVAQMGYLFLLFPLAYTAQGASAWSGVVLYLLAHAGAKAAMFMAASNLLRAYGHDRIAGLAGSAYTMPVTLFAFGLAGVTLMGLPPSGGFVAKWLLLDAALHARLWVYAAGIVLGGLLAAGYVFRVLRVASRQPEVHVTTPAVTPERLPARLEWTPLVLAALAAALGFAAALPLDLLEQAAPYAEVAP